MRILLAGSYLPDTRQGSPKVLLRLGAEFSSLGHEVRYVFLDSLPKWARHYRLAWFLFPFVVTANVFWAAIRKRPYDVVDASGGDGWCVALLKRRFGRGFGVICRSHGWEHEDYRVRVREAAAGWRSGRLMRVVRLPMVELAAKHSDAIIVGSSPVRLFALHRKWQAPDRVFVVPCGVDRLYLTRAGLPKYGLLYAGSWLPRKGVRTLAKAYELVAIAGCEIPLSVVGYGVPNDEVLRDFAPSLQSRVRVDESLRVLDEDRLMEEYGNHAILAFPSLHEGFGMVFLEAMASGVPVVATPVGGVVDLIRHGENGFIVPKDDPAALASAIMHLWRSPDERSRIGTAARQTAQEYTWHEVAKRTLDCYQQAIEYANGQGPKARKHVRVNQ